MVLTELLKTERNYLLLLVAFRDVYAVHLPSRDKVNWSHFIGNKEPRETFFPNLDEIITLHARINFNLYKLHRQSDYTIIGNLGDMLLQLFNSRVLSSFIRCYGDLMYAHNIIKHLVQSIRRDSTSQISQYFIVSFPNPRPFPLSLSFRMPSRIAALIAKPWTTFT
ncbi:hypothetical protein Ciccas_010986 [Cichlidogyrus casuarinus]|uniref:DH domain-containing protein n=1 Tax=Cichlidogyrus casuarinus TaxID=1844966 RepID=A0ABD2PTC7_9PLAT